MRVVVVVCHFSPFYFTHFSSLHCVVGRCFRGLLSPAFTRFLFIALYLCVPCTGFLFLLHLTLLYWIWLRLCIFVPTTQSLSLSLSPLSLFLPLSAVSLYYCILFNSLRIASILACLCFFFVCYQFLYFSACCFLFGLIVAKIFNLHV